jgi:hypothetical protein
VNPVRQTSISPEEEELRRIEHEVLRSLREIRFGSVEIVIHDGRVVQIERREKVRLDRTGLRVTG